MAENVPFVKPPESLEISTGNPAFFVGKMETEIRNLPRGNRSVEETGRNEGGTAI